MAMGRACGGRTRTRTLDPLIKSQLLYQLSYAPGCRASAQAGRAVAKPNIGVQNGLCTTKHAALWSAPIRGAARLNDRRLRRNSHDKTHPEDNGGGRRAGTGDWRRGRAEQAKGLDCGRRRRVPVLPADRAGEATRRI